MPQVGTVVLRTLLDRVLKTNKQKNPDKTASTSSPPVTALGASLLGQYHWMRHVL